jgi:hypothetical protein
MVLPEAGKSGCAVAGRRLFPDRESGPGVILSPLITVQWLGIVFKYISVICISRWQSAAVVS